MAIASCSVPRNRLEPSRALQTGVLVRCFSAGDQRLPIKRNKRYRLVLTIIFESATV